jgi:hypothetical protein
MNIVKQGDTLSRNIALRYKKTHAVVDLTGCTAYSQLRTKPGEELMLEGVTSINTETGTVSVVYSADQVETLDPGDYGFDVRLELGTERKTIYTERFTLVKPYTELGDDDEEGGE